jgi:hypothetical protein
VRYTIALRAVPLALLMPLAACGGDPGDSAPPASSAPAAAPAELPGIPLAFMGLGESGVTGTGRLVDEGESSLLTIELQGLPGAGSYNAHVHNGNCAELGGVAVRLTAVTGSADGTGTSSTTFGTADLPEGMLAVQVHGADGSGITCADIHRH